VAIPERWPPHATMRGIEHLLSFSMGETMTNEIVDTMMTKIITKEVARGLMSNTLSIIRSDIGGEFLGSQIGQDVAIPRII